MVHYHTVKTPSEALAYITDCNLATVCTMAFTKSRKKGEYQRQKDIAQRAINWMMHMKVDYSTTRAEEVVKDFNGSVDAWAKQFEQG